MTFFYELYMFRRVVFEAYGSRVSAWHLVFGGVRGRVLCWHADGLTCPERLAQKRSDSSSFCEGERHGQDYKRVMPTISI